MQVTTSLLLNSKSNCIMMRILLTQFLTRIKNPFIKVYNRKRVGRTVLLYILSEAHNYKPTTLKHATQ